MPRLFTAIKLPEDVTDDLAGLEMPLAGAKWLDLDDLHLTLRFVGDVTKRQADDFAEALSDIELDAFELRLQGLGTFGGNEPRVLWAGIAPSPDLEALARTNDRAARVAGLPPEGRKFKAHVTLARLRGTPIDRLVRLLERRGAFASRPFIVDRFELLAAKPLTGGGPYVTESVFPLRGAYNDFLQDEEANL